MRWKLAVARFLSKANLCMSTLITQAIPLAATAIKCNAFDWLHLLWTNMHREHAASVVHVILASQFMFYISSSYIRESEAAGSLESVRVEL